MTRKFIYIFIVIISIILLSQNSALAYNKSIVKGGFGIKFGIINGSTAHISHRKTDYKYGDVLTKPGLSFAVFFDIPQSRKWLTGIEFGIQDIKVSEYREKAIDLNLTLKHIIYNRSQRTVFKPFIGFGYAYLAELKMLEQVHFLTYRAGGEMVFLVNPKYAFLIELGFFGAPYGHNKTLNVTTNPILMLRAGFIF